MGYKNFLKFFMQINRMQIKLIPIVFRGMTMSSFAAFDSFQGDFDASEYVTKICAILKQEGAEVKNDFNCVPYIETLESNLLELKKFYLTIEKRVEKLSSTLESEQGEVNQKVSSLGAAFDEVFENFTNLNQASERISGTALRIGKQLESIQNERNRAEEAKEILGLFLEFNSTSKCSKIDSLMLNNSYESRLKLASYLRKLNHLAKADIPGAENGNSIIKNKFSSFENEALTNFMAAFAAEDISGMKDSSNILVTLNDASSCIKVFIEKHAFFQEAYNCSDIYKSFFSAPNNTRKPIDFSQPALVDSGLESVLDLILRTVSADWVYLEEIFDSPRSVMDTLLKKVFEEIIMRHIDEGLKCAGTHSTIQYLRYLSSTYGCTLDFIEKLLQMYREHMNDLPITSIDGAIEEIRSFLMALHKDIFSRYTKTSDIQMLESRFIKEVTDICAISTQNFVNSKKIAKASKNLFNIPTGSDPKIIQYAEVRHRSGFYLFKDGLLVNEQDFGSPIISSETLIRLLGLISEAIDRMVSFYQEKHELSEMIESYLSFFMENLRKSCITPSFLFIVENEDVGCCCKPFDARNFELIKNLNCILGLIQIYFEEQIIPVTSLVSSTCCRKMYELKNSFFEACLRYINKLLKLEINAISVQFSNIAQKYVKKSDYKPRADDLSAFNSSTQYCNSSKNFLRTCAKVMQQYLPPQNASKAINRIVKIFFEQLIELMKKITFNDIGAMVLLNDINAYSEMLVDFGPECQRELSAYFNFLRELSNVLMVKPENLRSVLQEGSLNLIDIKLFYPFIALRSDFKTSKIDSLFPEMASSNTTGGINTNGLF